MARPGHSYETLVWTDARCVPTVAAIVARMGAAVKVIGIGGPRTGSSGGIGGSGGTGGAGGIGGAGTVRDLAARLDCPFDDDLRRLIVDRPATYLLLATMESVTPALLAAAMAQGTIILSMEPVASEMAAMNTAQASSDDDDDDAPPPAAAPGRLLATPDFTRAEGWLSAADPQQVLGTLHSLAVVCSSGPHEASLFARLHEAWRIILELASIPESIDCVIHAPKGEGPYDLRSLTGSLTAHARLTDGGSAMLQLHRAIAGSAASPPSSVSNASSAAAPAPAAQPIVCDRMLHLIGEQGRLRVTDQDYQLYDQHGQMLDERARPSQTIHTFADAVADHWLQIIDRPALAHQPERDTPARQVAVLACCQACLLSARTGQPESPQRLMTAHGFKR